MFNRVKTNHCMKFAKFLPRIPADNQPQMHTVWPLKSNPEIPHKISGTWFQNLMKCFEVDVLITDFKSQSFLKSKCFIRFKDMNDLFISLVVMKLLFPGWTRETSTTNYIYIVYFRSVFVVTFGNVLYIVYINLYILYSPKFLLPLYFLLNISIIINTFVYKLHSSTIMKKVKISVVYRPSIALCFNTLQKIESLRGFCLANGMKSARMKMLKNCARSSENFRMNKRCQTLFFLIFRSGRNVWKKQS